MEKESKRGVRFFVFLFSFLVVILIVSGCNAKSLNKLTEAQKSKVGGELKFGVIPLEDPKRMEERFTPLADYLSDYLGVTVKLYVPDEYDPVVDKLGSGEIQIAFLGPVTYVQAKDKYPDVNPLVKATLESAPYYRSYIIVAKDSPIDDVSDLKGKRFAFGNIESTSSHLMPMSMLKDSNVLLTDLKSYKYLSGHDKVARAVAEGEFDAGGIMSLTYEENKDKLKMIKKSRPIPEFPIVASGKLDSEIAQKISLAFQYLDNKKSKHNRILKSINLFYDGYIPAYDSDYDIIRDTLVNVYGGYYTTAVNQ